MKPVNQQVAEDGGHYQPLVLTRRPAAPPAARLPARAPSEAELRVRREGGWVLVGIGLALSLSAWWTGGVWLVGLAVPAAAVGAIEVWDARG